LNLPSPFQKYTPVIISHDLFARALGILRPRRTGLFEWHRLVQNATNPPSITLPYGTYYPNLTADPSITKNKCNSYLPADSTLDRFVAIANLITANGLYVVRPSLDPQPPTPWIGRTPWQGCCARKHLTNITDHEQD
jgi:hypothetical protein